MPGGVVLFQDSELIDVLWKQDVDLGFSLIPPDAGGAAQTKTKGDAIDDSEDDIQKLKALLEIKSDEVRILFQYGLPVFCTFKWCVCKAVCLPQEDRQ